MHYKEILDKRLELTRNIMSCDMRDYHKEQAYLLQEHIEYLKETPFEEVVLNSDDVFHLDQIKYLYGVCEEA